MSATIHDEGKDIFVPMAFFDEKGLPVTPLTASYRLTKGDETQLIAWTAIGALAPSVEVTIPAVHNTVTGTGTETRYVAVKFTYGTPVKTGSAGIEYRIRNLPAYL
jgi:hypothetical protein